MTKIDIISGFLGAGKTTLIKKLLSEALCDEKVVLIENEFGEIGIDGGFLKEAGVQVTEMNSGCICCSLVGDFGIALREVLEKFTPDRVLIEPSGVGKLSDVIGAVEAVAKDLPVVLNSFVAVADAAKSKMYVRNFGEFYLNQIENACAILLSRTAELSEDALGAAVGLLREHNEKARIVTTPWVELTGKQLLDVMESSHSLAEEMRAEIAQEAAREHEHHHEHGADCGCGEHEHHHEHGANCGCGEHEHHHEHGANCGCGGHHGHHHGHDADEVFSSWGVETPHKYSENELSQVLDALDSAAYGMVLRAKGIVACTDGTWLHFDYVPGAADIRHGASDYTGRLCVIGSQLAEEKLPALFNLA